MRYSRYKAKGGDGKYTCPLDRQLGIEKNNSFSPNAQKRAVYLCVQYPYRQARDILSYELGCNVDHRSLWRLIQKKGIKLRKKRDDEVESLYTYAKPPKSDRRVREIVVIEADGTGISSQEGKGRWMEAKIGIIYTGKKLESETSKIKRYALENKTVYADIVDSDVFGKNMSYLGEEKYSTSCAENILLLSDGDKWIKNYQVSYLPGSIHQLDHYHLKKRLRQTYSGNPDLLDKALNLIHIKKEHKLPEFVRLSKINGAIEETVADELTSYIDLRRKHFIELFSNSIIIPINWFNGADGVVQC